MNLESYIRTNRDEMDVEKPDEAYLWTGILQTMNSAQKRKHLALWYAAASVALILAVSLTFIYLYSNAGKQQLIFVNIDPKLAEQEAQFKNQINSYAKLIKQSSINDHQLATSSNEIQYIDELIEHYSADLKQNGPNLKLINSLMDLYRKKIMLLERMLNEIDKSKDHDKRKINI